MASSEKLNTHHRHVNPAKCFQNLDTDIWHRPTHIFGALARSDNYHTPIEADKTVGQSVSTATNPLTDHEPFNHHHHHHYCQGRA